MNKKTLIIFGVLVALLILVIPASAQQAVTDDEVNVIAAKLYCPVCENIPLDACGTAACEDWRYEIRLQLEGGATEQEIIDDFVTRFGDRVVGTPQDPTLRALALVVPRAATGLGFLIVVVLLWRWWGKQRQTTAQPTTAAATANQTTKTDDYRSQLEQDLLA